MHTHMKKQLIKTALSIAIIAGAAGAATGTYAWYSYSKEVSTILRGTTIKADKEIQVGLRSTERLTSFENKYQLGEIEGYSAEEGFDNLDTVEIGGVTNYIYWIRGNYLDQILKDFQIAIGSADARLKPITAGKYTAGMDENVGDDSDSTKWSGFKNTPTQYEGQRNYESLVSDYHDYFYLPLVFRAKLEATTDVYGNGTNYDYGPETEIFLNTFDTSAELGAKGANLANAVRCKVDYPTFVDEDTEELSTANNFIFDPNETDDDYNLDVGGVLNLQQDNYYDYDLATKKQIAYGEFERIIPGETDEDPTTYEYISDYDDLDNLTGATGTDPVVSAWKTTATSYTAAQRAALLTYEDCSTFEANNLEGGYELDYKSDSDTQKIRPCTCETKAKTAAVAHYDNSTKEYDTPIVVTDTTTDALAFVDLSIYIEGWAADVVNDSSGCEFSVALEFAIN